MKKIFLSAVALMVCALAFAGVGVPFTKVQYSALGSSIKKTAEDAQSISLHQTIGCYYDPSITPADYYILLCDDPDGFYDPNTAELHVKDAWLLILDLYNDATNPARLPAGTYHAGEGLENGEYWQEYTILRHYDANGNIDINDRLLQNDVEVAINNGLYRITTTVDVNGTTYNVEFNGMINFDDITGDATIFPQIKQDMDLACTGALAYYHGNLYENNCGNIYIDLYTNAYNPETGGMIEDGFSVNMCAFHKLFAESSSATPMAGTYVMARTLQRNTYYPGMEIDYMGMTIPFGSYVKQRSDRYTDGYGYGYVDDGTMVIEENGDGTYTVTVDAITNLGYKLKATYTGPIPVEDLSDDHPGACISTLEDDVELDLDQLPVAHLWNNGIKNGTRSFILDIGSPSGRDPELDNGGDALRIEFLADPTEPYLLEGTYSVIPDRYPQSYAPFGLEQGYFSSTANGDLIGTRYNWFKTGSYYILYHLAPAMEGTVGVTKVPDETVDYTYRHYSGGEMVEEPTKKLDVYRFDIALIDDAGFHIDGTWKGGVELMYDPHMIASIDTIDSDAPKAQRIDRDTFRLTGIDANTPVAVYNTLGSQMKVTRGADTLNISALTEGLYILKVGQTTIKFIR